MVRGYNIKTNQWRRRHRSVVRRHDAGYINHCISCEKPTTSRTVTEPYICRRCRITTHKCSTCGELYKKDMVRKCPDCKRAVCENCECVCYDVYVEYCSDAEEF